MLLLTGLCGCGKDNKDKDTPASTDVTNEPTLAYQIGGDKVVLDGEVFTLGGSPDALFAHFGKPNKVEDDVELESGVGDVHLYYYENIIIKTHSLRLKNGERREMVRGIGFPNNHYSFDGITVGTSAKELDQKVSPRMTGWVNWCPTLDIFGGLYRQYPKPVNGKCLTYWQFFLTFEGETPLDELGEVVVPANSVVESIEILYPIGDFIDQYRDQLGDHHGSDIAAYEG